MSLCNRFLLSFILLFLLHNELECILKYNDFSLVVEASAYVSMSNSHLLGWSRRALMRTNYGSFSTQKFLTETYLVYNPHQVQSFYRHDFKLSSSNNDKEEKSNVDTATKSDKGSNWNLNIFNLYQSEIPESLRDEIYAIESKTPAAAQRGQRIALYTCIAIAGILAAFGNAFFSEIKSGIDPEMPTLAEAGFGWIESNSIFSFFLLNKIGGFLMLFIGGGSGLLAEAEFDTKRINAEKIFQELKRRKEARMSKSESQRTLNNKKRRPTSKEAKRLGALSEVLDEPKLDIWIPSSIETTSNKNQKTSQTDELLDSNSDTNVSKANIGKKLVETVTSFYKKADSMALSQALLLNKELEDRGIIEKITDESGLRVIGKEEAAKLLEKSPSPSNNDATSLSNNQLNTTNVNSSRNSK